MTNIASPLTLQLPDATAIISRGRATTYGELSRQIRAFRGALRELGVKQGARVASVAGNGRHFFVDYSATTGLGAVAVPLNPLAPAAELQREIAEVEASVVVVGPSAITAWLNIDGSSVPSVRHVIAGDNTSMVGTLAFDELLSHGELDVVPTDTNSLAVLMFTSGTAGAPKAAMLRHGTLLSNIAQTLAFNPMYAKDVFFGVLPLFHIFGLNVVLGCAMSSGASLVLIERFDPSTAVETIRERGISVMAGAPSMWAALGNTPGVDINSMSSVRLAITGAAKMPEDIAVAFEARCGVRLIEGYGLTEASPVVSTARAGVTPIGYIGQVLDNMNVRLVDEQGDNGLVGDTGEIWVQGPNVFSGYWNDAEATARVLTSDGWLRTGDIAVADEAGNLFIVDRAKDLIIVSGFNVYPAEVEDVLSDHPGIAQVAVVGVPHPHTGEAVKAFVVPQPNVYLDEDAIIAYSQQQLSRYKCPSKVLFVESLPVNATGKVLRRALR